MSSETFDLDTWPIYCQCSLPYQIWWPYLKRFLRYELLSSNFCLVTDRQTDGQTDRRKATPKSPPCISTGGLKNDDKYHNLFFQYGTCLFAVKKFRNLLVCLFRIIRQLGVCRYWILDIGFMPKLWRLTIFSNILLWVYNWFNKYNWGLFTFTIITFYFWNRIVIQMDLFSRNIIQKIYIIQAIIDLQNSMEFTLEWTEIIKSCDYTKR